MKLIPTIRQWAYPKELRIEAFAWPAEYPAVLGKLKEILSSPKVPGQEGVQAAPLAEIATNLWRMRQKMLQPGTDQPAGEMRRAYRHLESALDTLANAGIQIQDHTGDPVPVGGILGIKILAEQPVAGLTLRKVQETIKPTIYYRDQMIQMGEVIVSVPDEDGMHAPR